MEVTLTTHNDLYAHIDKLAPYQHAEPWDPTGPTIGWLNDQTQGVVLSLDLTNETLKIAKENHCNLIITHHPFLFSPIQKLMSDDIEQKLLLELIQNKITCFSCHTNLDAAENGVAVTFLKETLSGISFSQDIKILQANLDNPDLGHGRIVMLDKKAKLSTLIHEFEANLLTVIQVNTDQDNLIRRIVFIPGAFDEEWIPLLEEEQIDLLVTGEIKHHATVMLNERKIAVFAVGHGASEQTVIPYLAKSLKKVFPNINFVESSKIVYNYLRSE